MKGLKLPKFKNIMIETSLVVQWLKFLAPNAGGSQVDPRTGNETPHATAKSVHAETNTCWNQLDKWISLQEYYDISALFWQFKEDYYNFYRNQWYLLFGQSEQCFLPGKKSVLVLTAASLKSFQHEILALALTCSTIKYCPGCCESCILQDALKMTLVHFFSEFTSLLRKQMYCKTLKVLLYMYRGDL